MVNGTAFFQRDRNESGQLRSIFGILGIPSATERRLVPGVGKFEWSSFEDLQTIPGRPLAAAVPRLGPQGLDLLAQMLEFVPQHRISGLEALSHPYFKGLDFDN